MAALRYAMSKLAGGRALQRMRASPAASAPRSISAGVSLPPKHHRAAAGTTAHGNHGVTPVEKLDDTNYHEWVSSSAIALACFIGIVTGEIPRRFRDQAKKRGVAGYEAAWPITFRDQVKVEAVAGDGAPKTDMADD